ncbi:nuclear speckle splicing regulatory protein 1 isoform X2 [Ceratina calcarata]|uniref:Nuclear speckle splicing regulatory protein 1 isoform X2 n=1 Tax=Ceratina calcarata TaxID=156304 RepID=A0AAJ7JBA5_9HYME|nr:nuclear speckle splicing regulatory protein 1 isoform X2 [Ceratina calcarata]
MSYMKEEKQYGLILPKKQQSVAPKVSNVFGDNDDSDEEDGTDWVKKALQAEGEKHKIKKQTKLNMQKALKEDPTIFQYDEVYEDIEKKKDQSKGVRDEKKKPKYIQNLLKAAERRKKEQEYRIERMVQKEREAEGEMYADKESFVTSAYRAKLEEFKKLEEEENNMDRLEAIGDVRKQQDMSGFYRHLYEQTIEPSKESDAKNDINNQEIIPQIDASKENVVVSTQEQIKNKEMKKNRQYRQRKIEEDSDSDTDIQQKIDNTTSTAEKRKNEEQSKDIEKMEPEAKKQKQEIENNKPEETSNDDKLEHDVSSKNSEKGSEENKNDENDEKERAEKASISAKAKIEAEKKEKAKIWVKRTIGPVFEAALERYYARKAMRTAAS